MGSCSTELLEREFPEAPSDVVSVLEEYYRAEIITVQTLFSSDNTCT